jgi:hypothetical protein
VKLKIIITFIKWPRKKIKNQNNDNQIKKYNTINLNCVMKLKNTKIFTKRLSIKIRILKNEDHIRKYNI